MGRATIVPLVTRSHGNVRLDSDEPAGAADNSDVPCSRPAPSAQPVKAPAPLLRSGIAGLPAHGLWPELTVATGSSRSSFGHTAPGYLCPYRHSWTDTHADELQEKYNGFDLALIDSFLDDFARISRYLVAMKAFDFSILSRTSPHTHSTHSLQSRGQGMLGHGPQYSI